MAAGILERAGLGLMRMNPGVTGQQQQNQAESPRRFHAYNVGIAKTGTTSIGLMFKRYKSGHEYMFAETTERILAWHDGEITKESLRQFILLRDRQGGLEMDSSTFNHHYLDILLEEFPESKFIFTIRDCYSWLDSILNMSLKFGGAAPEYRLKYGRIFGIEMQRSELASIESFLRRSPQMLDALFKYWSESNKRVLERLPQGRALIIRTNEITASLSGIARFVGVPESSLIAQVSHSNRGARDVEFLKLLDRRMLEEVSAIHCGELMKDVFPNVTLDTLNERASLR